jgi:hypothetical protein
MYDGRGDKCHIVNYSVRTEISNVAQCRIMPAIYDGEDGNREAFFVVDHIDHWARLGS